MTENTKSASPAYEEYKVKIKALQKKHDETLKELQHVIQTVGDLNTQEISIAKLAFSLTSKIFELEESNFTLNYMLFMQQEEIAVILETQKLQIEQSELKNKLNNTANELTEKVKPIQELISKTQAEKRVKENQSYIR
jgi:hypothetical protein